MIYAKFELGWMTLDCEGETPSKAFLEIEKTQDIDCFVGMAAQFGEGARARKLMKEFVMPARNGELTLKKLRTLDFEFGPGPFRCIEAKSDDPAADETVPSPAAKSSRQKNVIREIEIKYDEEKECTSFDCPYCGKTFVLPDEVNCRHCWFGYESVNRQPLEMDDSLRSAIEEKLMDHRTRGPESFSDIWLNEYRPEKEDPECYAEEYESAREECVGYYLDSVISMDDVLWFMDRLPQFRGFRAHAAIASADDGEGNSTSYLFLDDSFDDE